MKTVGMITMAVLCSAACKKAKTEEVAMGSGSATGSGSAIGKPIDAAGSASEAKASTDERWAATIVLGSQLRDFVVHFTKQGDAWTATLEGLTKKPLDLAKVSLAADKIAFTLEKPGAPEATWEHYELARTDKTAIGAGTIGGATLPIRMAQLADGEAPRSAYARPQTPKPPFPYEEREVVVDAPDGGKLAGTLTVPKSGTPAAAVLLWSGSGQQDRDETIFGHKPYLILADRLTRAGLVVLRLDDRLTGKTTGAFGTLDSEIADAGAAVEFLTKQKEVDPKRIGLVGHSTGGMVVPNVAVKHPVAFIVSLAGVAIPGRELVPLQQDIRAKKAGVELPADQVETQKKVGEAAVKGPEAVKKVLEEAIGQALEKALGHKPTKEELEQASAKPIADATQPWSMSFFKIDPREAWKKLSVPTLLVVGDLDTQVPADVTIKALEESHAKKDVLTTKKLPGLNHLFQHAKTGLEDEYPEIEESFDPATLDIIVAWVGEHAK